MCMHSMHGKHGGQRTASVSQSSPSVSPLPQGRSLLLLAAVLCSSDGSSCFCLHLYAEVLGWQVQFTALTLLVLCDEHPYRRSHLSSPCTETSWCLERTKQKEATSTSRQETSAHFLCWWVQVTVCEVDKTRLVQVQGRCRTDRFVLGRMTQ